MKSLWNVVYILALRRQTKWLFSHFFPKKKAKPCFVDVEMKMSVLFTLVATIFYSNVCKLIELKEAFSMRMKKSHPNQWNLNVLFENSLSHNFYFASDAKKNKAVKCLSRVCLYTVKMETRFFCVSLAKENKNSLSLLLAKNVATNGKKMRMFWLRWSVMGISVQRIGV